MMGQIVPLSHREGDRKTYANIMKMNFNLAALAALALAAAHPAHAQTTVNYTAAAAFTQAAPAPYQLGGITASGTGLLKNSGGGLGILGGRTVVGNAIIDGSESVLFTFNAGPATSVSYAIGVASSFPGSTITITGYGADGASLGDQQVPVLNDTNVSALYSNVPLSGFRYTGGGTNIGASIASISYTPAPAGSAVPEPGSVGLLVSMATVGAGVLRKRRK